MSARIRLASYHARIAYSWRALIPILALASATAVVFWTTPSAQGSHRSAVALEVALPLLSALLAAPLLVSEREHDTLTLLAVRTPLDQVISVRLGLLVGYLLALCTLSFLAACLLWPDSRWSWAIVFYAGVPALAFGACALFAALWGRSTIHGYVPTVGFWLLALMLPAYVPQNEIWQSLLPFPWAFGYADEVILHSTLLYAAAGVLFLLASLRLARKPERQFERL